MLGTDNLKKIIDVGLEFGKELAADLQDKKISIFEGIALIDNIFASVGVAKTLSVVRDEILDLDEAETLDLENHVISKFKIPKEKVKLFIDHAITQIFSLIALVNEFKHINDPVI